MEYNRLIDRKAETDRITEALKRENSYIWSSQNRKIYAHQISCE